jgi:hypothetical protein
MQVKQRLEDMFRELPVESQQGSYRITNCKEVTGDVSSCAAVVEGYRGLVTAVLIKEGSCTAMHKRPLFRLLNMAVLCRHTSAQEKATR